MISITSRPLGVLVIKPAKGGAQLSVNAAGNPSQIKVRLDIARQGPPGANGSGSGVAMTGGAGIVVVGSEIRLSIGTLPNMN